MTSRAARVARGFAAAVTTTGAAAVSHGIAGGRITAIALVVALLFSATVCLLLVGRRLSPLRLGAAVAISQLGFHLLFASLGGGHLAVVAGHHGGRISADVGSVHAPADAGMWVGHAIAALVTAVLLTRGERAALGLAAGVLAVRRHQAVEPVSIPVERSTAVAERVVRPCSLVVSASSLSYRGPPAIRFA